MGDVRVDFTYAYNLVREEELAFLKPFAMEAKKILLEGTGAGNDFLGWVNLPKEYDQTEFARIQKAAEKIKGDSEVLLVIGIGGSYLGARAAVDFVNGIFANACNKGFPEVYFVGNGLSGDYMAQIAELLDEKDFSINVISKSGTTTEPAIAFRYFKAILEEKYGKEEAAKRIYATTDRQRGALKAQADSEGYETFVVPDDIGGRYSVLTAVGLLPIAASGIDIEELMKGGQVAREKAINESFESNDAMLYATMRHVLLKRGLSVEILGSYDPALQYLTEWWKQLYGESEGKDKKGLYPASVNLTADLHSMGQFIQDGARIMFETILFVEKSNRSVLIPHADNDGDGLNYLAGKDMDFANKSAMQGTMLAHTDGNVPNILIRIPDRSAYALGQLFYFFEFACGISGYMLGVNPFDQPGVESYKKNMFALLGKPGFEAEGEALRARLQQ